MYTHVCRNSYWAMYQLEEEECDGKALSLMCWIEQCFYCDKCFQTGLKRKQQ